MLLPEVLLPCKLLPLSMKSQHQLLLLPQLLLLLDILMPMLDILMLDMLMLVFMDLPMVDMLLVFLMLVTMLVFLMLVSTLGMLVMLVSHTVSPMLDPQWLPQPRLNKQPSNLLHTIKFIFKQ